MQPKGKPPCPRYGSSLVYVQSLESVFLYGGRNNMIDQKQKGFFNDMYVYRVYSNEWMECTCINSEQIPRANHCTFLKDTKLFLFGGLNYEGYCSSQMEIIELDHNIAVKIEK